MALLLGDAHDLALLEIAGAKLRLANELLKLAHARKFQLQNAASRSREKIKCSRAHHFFLAPAEAYNK
jgi:hypothetical protein